MFDTNPLYAIMHESIYCQGAASNWSAQLAREEPSFAQAFDAVAAANANQPVMFTGANLVPAVQLAYACRPRSGQLAKQIPVKSSMDTDGGSNAELLGSLTSNAWQLMHVKQKLSQQLV